MLLVASVPVAHSQTKTVAQTKKVTTWGHGASCLTSRPHAHKVMWITHPLPEVLPTVPPAAGPSQVVTQPLFVESVASDVRETEPKVAAPSGESALVLSAQIG